jgi:hypothetical protein
MLRKLSISRTIGRALVLFLVLTTLVVPVVAQDPTYSIELWLKADGSGHGVISAYLPAGGETSDQIVANLEGVGSLTGVTKKDLGGDNWEITLSWASFDQAFTPDSWTEMSGSVEASFDSLTQSYQETTVHLPGMITQSGTGTMLDSQTIVFSMGDTNAYVSFSATSGSPSPSSSTTSSSLHGRALDSSRRQWKSDHFRLSPTWRTNRGRDRGQSGNRVLVLWGDEGGSG